jgi:hypothetical protein
MAMSRVDLQRLSQSKFDDALLLCQQKRYSSAYYLAGYAVEMGLKACAAKQVQQFQIPDRAFVNGIFTHDLAKLVGLAGLTSELKASQDLDNLFSTNWAITAEWSPDSRYAITDSMSAEWLLTAIGDDDHGVLKWIKAHW